MHSYREWFVLPRSTHYRLEFFRPKLGTSVNCRPPESSFKTSFRMTPNSFYRLHALLRPYIEKKTTHLRPTVDSKDRLAIFLYHIAHGASYTTLTDLFAVGRSTVSDIIRDVSRAIVQHLLTRHIRFPSVDEAMRTIEHWKDAAGIPGVIACVDGTHIPILQPAHSGTAYCNRKGYYSINVQGMALFV